MPFVPANWHRPPRRLIDQIERELVGKRFVFVEEPTYLGYYIGDRIAG